MLVRTWAAAMGTRALTGVRVVYRAGHGHGGLVALAAVAPWSRVTRSTATYGQP